MASTLRKVYSGIIYSADDSSLTFYNGFNAYASSSTLAVGGTFNDKTITAMWDSLPAVAGSAVNGKRWGTYSTAIKTVNVLGDGSGSIRLNSGKYDDYYTLPADCSYLFAWLTALTSLDLTKFKMGGVTNALCMFFRLSGLTSIELDSTGLDASKLTDARYMFGGCIKLSKISVAEFELSGSCQTASMFVGDTQLPNYDSSKLDGSMAVPTYDGGYLTSTLPEPSSTYLASRNDLKSVASSIRTKSGKTDKLSFPDGFTSAIDSLPTVTVDGEKVTGDLALVSGVYDVLLQQLPYYNNRGCTVVFGNSIHVLGSYSKNAGSSGGYVENYKNHYSWNGHGWTKHASLPTTFFSSPAVTTDESLYILGCNDSYSYDNATLYRWDQTSDSWTKLSNRCYAQTYTVNAAVLGNYIYAVSVRPSDYPHVMKYDIENDVWFADSATDPAPVPTNSLMESELTTFNGAIYAAAIGSNVNNLYMFNGHVWTIAATLPANTWTNSTTNVTVHDNSLCFVPSDGTVYSWDGSSWTLLRNISTDIRPAYRHSLVDFNGELHAIGTDMHVSNTVLGDYSTYKSQHLVIGLPILQAK